MPISSLHARTKKTIPVFLASLFGLSFFFFFTRETQAAAVAVTVSSPANAEFAALTATDVTFGYTASASEFAAANTINVFVSPTLPDALVDCTSATVDADGDTTSDGALGSFTTSGAIYTFTDATTLATTGGIDLCIKFPATTTAGNYSIALTDDNDTDFGAALVYVGDDNDVTITAQVTPSLAFAIRNSTDTGDTNVCGLGLLTLTTVNTCSYRLKVSTNSGTGYTVQITSNGDLSKNGTGDVADADDIDLVTENTTVTAGTEGYGIAFAGGAATGGSITESGDFNDDDTPIPMIATNIYTSNGPNNPGATDTTNTAQVTHRAAIDAGTGTGSYTQIVTYYVAANF